MQMQAFHQSQTCSYWHTYMTYFSAGNEAKLPCLGCNRFCWVSRTSADRWHVSPTSQIANCMISSAKETQRCPLQGSTLRLCRAAPPLPLRSPGFSATGRGICGRSLQRKSCKVHWPHRIAKHASTSLYKASLFMTRSSPPDGRENNAA